MKCTRVIVSLVLLFNSAQSSIAQLGDQIGFGQYIQVFQDNEIDGEAVKDLNNDFLKYLVPVLKHRMTIRKYRSFLFV